MTYRQNGVWSGDVAAAVAAINEYMKTLKSEDVIIYDTAALLADQYGQVKAAYRFDFLHLNEAGYVALNEGLEELLLEIYTKKAAKYDNH